MPIINRPLVNSSNDNEHYEVLVKRQTKNDKNHDTSRIYASFPLGSTVVVQWEDGGLQTHGTVVGRPDHNHNNRSYIICITKTGWLIIRKSKHAKVTTITAEQYLWGSVKQKHCRHCRWHPKRLWKVHTTKCDTYNEWLNKDTPENKRSDRQQTNMQDNTRWNSSPSWIAVNNEQKDNPNYMPIYSNHEEPNENTSTCTRNGRIVKWPDRLM